MWARLPYLAEVVYSFVAYIITLIPKHKFPVEFRLLSEGATFALGWLGIFLEYAFSLFRATTIVPMVPLIQWATSLQTYHISSALVSTFAYCEYFDHRWIFLSIFSCIVVIAAHRFARPRNFKQMFYVTLTSPFIFATEYFMRSYRQVSYIYALTNSKISYPVTFASRLITLCYQIYYSRCALDIVMAFNAYINAYVYYEDVGEHLRPLLTKMVKSILPKFKPQATKSERFLEFWGVWNTSSRVRGLRQALLTIFCLPAIVTDRKSAIEFLKDDLLLDKMTKECAVKTGSNSIFNVVTQVHWIFSRALPLILKGEYSTLLLDDDDFSSWLEGVTCHLALREKLRTLGGITVDEFLATCKEYEEDAKLFDAKIRSSSIFHNAHKELVKAIAAVESEYGACRPRAQPFSCLLYGPVGTGKSVLSSLLSNMFHNIEDTFYGRPCSFDPATNIYVRNFNDDYWSGYDSNIHRTTIMDEIASEPKQHLRNSKGLSQSEIIKAVNHIAYLTNQARLEDKGKVSVRSTFIIGTTNTKGMNAHLVAEDPAAILRRFPWVITVLKDKCEPSSKIDYSAWKFKLEHAHVVYDESDGGKVEYDLLLDGVGSLELLSFMSKEMQKYFVTGQHLPPNTTKAAICQHFIPKDICNLCTTFFAQADISEKDIPALPKGSVYASFMEACHSPIEEDDSPVVHRDDDEWYYGGSRHDHHIVHEQCDCDDWMPNPIKWIPGIRKFVRTLKEDLLYTSDEPDEENPYLIGRVINSVKSKGFTRDAIQTGVNVCTILGFSIVALKMCQVIAEILYMILGFGDNYVPQGAYQSKEHKPTVTQNDFWVEGPKRSECLTRKGKCVSFDDANQVVKRNVRYFEFDVKGFTVKQMMLGVSGTSFLTTAHVFKGLEYPVKLKVSREKNPTGGNFTHVDALLRKDHIKFSETADLVLLYLPHLQPVRDLKHLFFKSQPGDCGVGVLHTSTQRRFGRLKESSAEYSEGEYNFISHGLEYAADTRVGDCGAPLVVQTGSVGSIYGIHCCGSITGTKGLSVFVPRDFLDSQIDFNASIGDTSIVEDQIVDIQPSVFKKSALLHKSVPQGACVIYGSRSCVISSKSHVERTPVANFCEEELKYEQTHDKPLMRGKLVDGQWVDPWVLNATKCVQPAMITTDIKLPARNYYLQILPLLKYMRKPLTLSQSLNGIDGVLGFNRIPMSTSAGAPWHEAKSHLVIQGEPTGEHKVCYFLKPEVKEMYDKMLSLLKGGERCFPVFMSHLKDEPTLWKKCRAGKTRVFSGCNFAFSLIVRQYFLPIIEALKSDPFLSETAIGVNSVSEDWAKFYHYLTEFGLDRLIAGDYEKFDKKMIAEITLAAYHILIRFAQASELYSPEDIRVMYALATDLTYPLIDHHGDIISFYGGNPSGSPLTTILNSIVNSLYIRIAYRDSGNPLASFKRFVNLTTFGDDNAMGVGKTIQPFNHTVIQRELAKYGIVYTMADKEAESRPFIHIDEVSFLKRKFVKMEDGRILSPLEWASVQKSLLTWVKSRSVSAPEQLFGTLSCALRESSLHSSSRFGEIRRIIDWSLENVKDFSDWSSQFPNVSYDEYRENLFEGWEVLGKDFYDWARDEGMAW